jgi:hypothetical protein
MKAPRSTPDPAHLAQVMLQMEAAKVEEGLLTYWTLSGSRTFKVARSRALVAAMAMMMKHVVEHYVQNGARAPPENLDDLGDDGQEVWAGLMHELAQVAIAETTVELQNSGTSQHCEV